MRGKDTRTADKAAPICQQLGEKMGFEIIETAFDKEPAGLYLRIYLDTQHGISLDDCEKFHRAVQPLLEDIAYDFLEVCSPGADRPIKSERDAQKCIGTDVEIKLFKPYAGKKIYRGIFKGFAQDGYAIETPQQTIVFPKKDVAVARQVIDLNCLENTNES
jgi:ribosome maturation factor RimP